jgi:predicted phosphodiesterase
MYTLAQAAKAVGKAKSTVFEAIRSGQLSATKDEKGRFKIDPAELQRVYAVNGNSEQKTEQEKWQIEQNRTPENDIKTALLEQELHFLKKQIEQLEQVKTDLQEDRDRWRKQAEQTTILLTHQPQSSPTQKTGFFSTLFSKVF